MEYNKKLIDELVKNYCPNDLNIKDYCLENCSDDDGCRKCWIASLDRMEKHR